MNLSLLLSQLFNGLQTGSIYALVALGYSMVYGIILLLNFAHGDIIMVGRICRLLRHDELPSAPHRICYHRGHYQHAPRRCD